jgi:hypothetical protein
MFLGDAIEEISNIADQLIQSMSAVSAKELGLDPRSCYGTVYVSDEGLAVEKHNDRGLQYYGGFEYVDADDRYELGEYVFYTADSDRVRDCIDCLSSAESAA